MEENKRKSFVRFCMKVYLFLRKFWDKVPEPSEEMRNLCMSKNFREFSDLINQQEYQYDQLHGLLDNTYDYNKFFEERDFGKDCDDWARIWDVWGVLNGYEAKEWVTCSCTSIVNALNTMHVITTISKDGQYYLCNYDIYGPYSSEQEALDVMGCWESYRDQRITEFYRQIDIK